RRDPARCAANGGPAAAPQRGGRRGYEPHGWRRVPLPGWKARGRSSPRFPLEQRSLAVGAPAITRRRAIAAYDAVTGNRDGECVRPAGLRHRPHGARCPDAPRDLRVAHGGPRRNGSQHLPHPPLECRPPHVERKVDGKMRILDDARDLGQECLGVGIAAWQGRLRETPAKIALERLGAIAEQNGADTLFAAGDQNGTQRALTDGEAHYRARAWRAVGLAGHHRGPAWVEAGCTR